MLQNNAELKSKIDQLWNKFWSGGISNPLTVIEQITYLLFMKKLDENDLNKQADAEFTGEKYTSKFEGTWVPPEYRTTIPEATSSMERLEFEATDRKNYGINKNTLRWSEFKRMQAEDMLNHVQGKVFPFLKDLNGAESNFTHHMKNAVFIIPKPSLMVEAVKTIDEIFVVMEKDAEQGQNFQDIQGDVYEFLLSEIASAGKNGQFRTPRHIIKLLAELVQPKLGQSICDPACGTGGFLLGGYQYVVTQLAVKAGVKELVPDEDGFVRTSVAATLSESAQAILDSSLFGYDIDGTMVRLGLMNLMMHGINEPQIDYKDTLSKSFTEEACYDIIMANPPFTGSVDKGDINEDLIAGTKSELLFLENIYRLLKKGGTAGVIIPQGVLFGTGKAFQYVRQILIERCELKAVISMPSGVFKPYAGVSTAILLFTKVWGPKDKVDKPATENVWFYDMTDDGYTLDDKRTKKDGFGDLQDIVDQFHNRGDIAKNEQGEKIESDRSHSCFTVTRKDIENENYDLTFSRYKEDVYEVVKYDSPSDIIDRLLKAEVGDANDLLLKKFDSGIIKDLLNLRECIE
jgi:type I restriction enzyme M protein